MKKLNFLVLTTLILISTAVYSNGVAIVNAQTGVYLRLTQSVVSVDCESQVSIVTATQYFYNGLGSDKVIKYAFPLPEGASATSLRWRVNGQWYQAIISPNSQDTGMPGGQMNTNLRTHHGNTPLFFSVPQTIKADSTIIVELTYVQLLAYSFGNVNFTFPDDYHLIQSLTLNQQRLDFTLTSPRTIDSIRMLSSHTVTQFSNTGNFAYIQSIINEAAAVENYKIKYSLNLSQLGLYSYSTLIPQSELPDSLGGFFTFIAEPDPSANTQIIRKVFTLMVDRSGSMAGTKIAQAISAAVYIVQNLNEGDKFNIVDFSDNIHTFRTAHENFTPMGRDSAITYVQGFQALGNTDISGAFGTAVPQFAGANDSTANIIIFLTDGQPTVGITNTTQLLAYVHNLILTTETNIFLYCFGIGSDVNTQLLTLLGSQNSGLAEFLGNDELYSRITDFYNRIRNPVLLRPTISFSPANVTEVYPNPLPNLYKGQQMIVSGRYLQTGRVDVTLTGFAFNHPVSYQYGFNRVDSNAHRYQFLTKIWAKQKIDYLLVLYYALDPNSPEAIALKQQIIRISLDYSVISPFTSFGSITKVDEGGRTETGVTYRLLGNYPNPFNPSTAIKFYIGKQIYKPISIKIYNVLGQLVKELILNVNGKGIYEVKWLGDLSNGTMAPSGVYFYVIDFGDMKLPGKMVLLK